MFNVAISLLPFVYRFDLLVVTTNVDFKVVELLFTECDFEIKLKMEKLVCDVENKHYDFVNGEICDLMKKKSKATRFIYLLL